MADVIVQFTRANVQLTCLSFIDYQKLLFFFFHVSSRPNIFFILRSHIDYILTSSIQYAVGTLKPKRDKNNDIESLG